MHQMKKRSRVKGAVLLTLLCTACSAAQEPQDIVSETAVQTAAVTETTAETVAENVPETITVPKVTAAETSPTAEEQFKTETEPIETTAQGTIAQETTSQETTAQMTTAQETKTEPQTETLPAFERPPADPFGYYITPYGEFPLIEEAAENNAYMLAHPSVLTEELGLAYLCGKDDDPEKVKAELFALSDEITAGLDSGYDKACAIARYVAENIYYNLDYAEESGGISVLPVSEILKTKTGTCIGYSNLTAALCAAQDIPCLILLGGSASDGWTRGTLMEAPVNHSWNAFYADGQWYMCDTAWASNNYFRDGEYYVDNEHYIFLDFYLAFGFYEMTIEHRIDRCELPYGWLKKSEN